MSEYKSGDIVRVFYPYFPKQMNESGNLKGKVRYGLIISSGNNNTIALPILAIMSHGGKTQHADYILRDDEVKVPEGVEFFKRSKGMVPINGVIKTERIAFFDNDEISKSLTTVDLNTKVAVIEAYKKIMQIPYYIRNMNRECPNHNEVMNKFESTIIAEKLGFITTELGEFKFEEMEDEPLRVKKIQYLGKDEEKKRIHFYGVELTTEESSDSFFYTFATMKQNKQVAKEWGGYKLASEWLKEDERYYIFQKNLRLTSKDTPVPHPNKYEAFHSFKSKSLSMELER